jgi:hypothetical protein
MPGLELSDELMLGAPLDPAAAFQRHAELVGTAFDELAALLAA